MQLLVGIARATRYEMSTPLVYRRAGAQAWQTGNTVNVSRTGVLFTGQPPYPDTASEVEFVLALPSLGVRGRPRVQCHGRVVRRHDESPAVPVALAVTIDHYQILSLTATDPTALNL